MRNISFSLTTEQFLDGSKDVTRRLGWRNARPGQLLMACRKCMGLKPGEEIERLGKIRIVSVREEPLNAITPEDVVREGFPDSTPADFVLMFCGHHKAKKCRPTTPVVRIEFERVEA